MTPTGGLNKHSNPPELNSKAARLKQVRQLHLYLGTFFAPSIVFFALTGAIQLFGLHEARPGGTYQPPALIVKLGALHKNQDLGEEQGPSPQPGGAETKPGPEEIRRPPPRDDHENQQPKVFTYLLKWFFLGTSLGLILTTFLGIYMAFKYNRSRNLVWGLLLGGTLIPAALIAMLA